MDVYEDSNGIYYIKRFGKILSISSAGLVLKDLFKNSPTKRNKYKWFESRYSVADFHKKIKDGTFTLKRV